MTDTPLTAGLVGDLLREADGLLLGLLNNELIGVYVIQDSRFVFVNNRLAAIFGYPPDELSGQLGPRDLTAPADRAMVDGEVGRRLDGQGKHSHYCFRGLRKDGSEIEAEVFGARTEFRGRPAIVGMLVDVTDRQQAERALEEQFNFTTQLLEAIPNPVFYKDERGRYIGCNVAFEHFTGQPRASLVGRSVYEISPRDLAERYHAADKALFDHPGVQTYEANVATPDGSRRDVVFYKATFNRADGRLGGLVGVILDITERKQAEALIWRQANYDTLTGLPNRRLLLDRLEQELKRAHRDADSLALLFIDLDRFKEVNDTLGHETGDQLLIEAARRITGCVRESDTVARQGGDEFTVILPGLEEETHVEQIAQNILRELLKPYQFAHESVYISASIGITVYPRDGEDAEALLKHADRAMYDAKAQGKNCFSFFTPSMQQRALDRVQLGNDLRNAMGTDQFEVFYQPIVDFASGRTVKAEALLRWHHPTRGNAVGPAEFIPIAEDIGLINELGDWVFRQAAAMAKRWCLADAGHPDGPCACPVQIAVNKSPRQFITGDSHETWIDYLREIDLPGACLAIEITEGLLLDERPEVTAKLSQFRDAHMQIALDDFGTGYSAMAYLKRFDIDTLKIDRSFIRDMAGDASDRAIVEAIIAMSHKLGLKTVAEGVETEQQAALLRAAGCDFGQGFLFARPMPAAEFSRRLALRER